MGTIKISKILSNIKDKVAKQHAEPIVKKNLYTILGFKGREDFENKTSKRVNKEVWQLFIDCFEKEIDYLPTEQVVKNIVCNIAKSASDNAFTKTERLILNEKQDNKKREKAIEKAIGILRKINPEKAFNELLVMKKEAEGFLQTDFYEAQSKPLQGFAPPGGQLFEKTLKYIESLEKLAEVKKEGLIEDFLSSYVSSLNKKHPELQGKRKDAIAILSSTELGNFYDKGIEEGLLQPMVSYEECKSLYDKMNQMENESKSIIEGKKRKENPREIGESIVSIINNIKKHREAILNCKNFQNSYVQEKKEHPLRGSACQKMIDIYQERIAGYQEKICQNLIQIRELFKNMPQEICGVEEFEETMDNMYETKQIDENLDLTLIRLSSIQNELNAHLEKMENPPTELRVPHTNAQTGLTRL